MDNKDAFLKRLLGTFKVEADEYIQHMSAALIELENTANADMRRERIETVFRLAHSLKGAARAVDRNEIEALCQSMENLLSALKRGTCALSEAVISLLLEAIDQLTVLLQNVDKAAPETQKVSVALAARLNQAVQQMPPEPGPVEPVTAPRPAEERTAPRSDTLRIAAAKLDGLLLQVEGLLTAKLSAAQRVQEVRETRLMATALHKQRSKINLDIKALQKNAPRSGRRTDGGTVPARLRKVLDFLGTEEGALRMLEIQLTAQTRAAERDHRNLSGMVDNLLEDVKKALVLPVATMLDVFPKLVRDLARDSGKDVGFATSGGDIEIDRRILEELRDPLIHIVRNCLDHGIETPAERQRCGKSARGSISIAAMQREGDQVQIVIDDDGAGIDTERVRDAAVRLGLRTQEELAPLSTEQLLPLMFLSGVSTSPAITDISGRGLGLAIVREKVEKLGGTIAVITRPRAGTRFTLTLPVTLATYRGVHVIANGRQFVFPITKVEQVAMVRRASIKTVDNQEVISMNGRVLALARLSALLELPRSGAVEPDAMPVVIAAAAEQRIALLVDEVLGEQEVLVKGLGRQLQRVRNIAAVTVLGNGRIVPILHVADLIKSAAKNSAPLFGANAADEPTVRKSILVAEDSITSRLLLKGVLESAGYAVTTAVDGEEALTRVRAGQFDLVVSDVDMPRMSGFDLTARIRADAATAQLPVLLVTALSSREDRERGVDAGASAYIVKSNFDQSNLLDVVRRLL